MMASRTDLVAGLPSRAAAILCEAFPLRIAGTTFPLPAMDISVMWHERTDADPGAQYFRNLVADAVRDGARTGRAFTGSKRSATHRHTPALRSGSGVGGT